MKPYPPLLVVFTIALFISCDKDSGSNPDLTESAPLALHTEGRWILNSKNEKMILRSVNTAQLEWSSDAAHIQQTIQTAIDQWNVNLIRLPLSQDRWFGHGAEQVDQGVSYQSLVRSLVDMISERNCYVISGENIVYDTHCYPWKDRDWDDCFGNVGRQLPILVGEWGGNVPEDNDYFDALTAYLRDNQFCWTAWDFHPSAGPCLIGDWTYEPTGFGQIVLDELTQPVILD